MIIKARIHKARKEYHCPTCRKIIKIGQLYLRLYGCAERGDPLYEITEHITCVFPLSIKGDGHEKIFKAFEKREIKLKFETIYAIGILYGKAII